MFFLYYTSYKLQKWLLTPPFGAAMPMTQNQNKNILLGGKTMDIPEKKVENIIVHGLMCK